MNNRQALRERFIGNMHIFCTFLLSLTGINIFQFLTKSKALNASNEKSLSYGVLSGELLLETIIFTALVFLLYIAISAFLKKYSVKLATTITYLILVSTSILSWQSYNTIGDFVGIYSIQMLYNDAGQIIDLSSRMPSMTSFESLPYFMLVVALTLYLALSTSTKFDCIKTPLVAITTLGLVVVSWNSTSFNKVDSEISTGSANLDAKVSRINKTNFDLASMHAGPFTKLAKDIFLASRASSTGVKLAEEKLHPIMSNSLSEVSSSSLSPDDQLNVVYIIVESLRSDIIGETNNELPLMPFTSELAKNSYNFTNVWAQSSHSNYADISTISGQYPLRSEFIHFYPKKPAYPISRPWDHLRKYGYASALVSSQNENWGGMNNYLNSKNLDLFNHVGSSFSNDPQKTKKTSANLTFSDDGKFVLDYGSFMYRGEEGNSTQRYDEQTASIAVEWSRSLDKEKPFLLYLNFQASHYPYNYFPETHLRRHLTDDSEAARKTRKGDMSITTVDFVKNAYYDSLDYVDKNIKHVFDSIESRNPGKTIYVITADTGTYIDTNFLGNGGTLYPDVINIPALIYDPRLSKAVTIDEPTAQIDLLPTIYGLLNVIPDPAVQGIDAISNRLGKNRAIFSIAQTPAAHEYAVIEGEWQLIFDYQAETNTAFYVGDREEITASDMPKEKMQSMALKLQHWISTQLQYYGVERNYKSFYPPSQTYYESMTKVDSSL